MICRKYVLQTLIQFSLGNNVVDAPDSNWDGYLWRDTCVSSNQLNRPIWNKMTLSPHWNLWFFSNYTFQKPAHFLQEKNVLNAPASNIDGCLWRNTCVSSSLVSRPIWDKETLSPSWQAHIAGSFPFNN
jgi:hypothetical protein